VRSRAIGLLRRVVEASVYSPDDIARELLLTPADIAACLDGTQRLSLDRQLDLANFVIERVPALARDGYTLRSQVNAATAFAAHTTKVHSEPPGRHAGMSRKRLK